MSLSGSEYSIWRAVAFPTPVPKKWLTIRNAKSIPAETPAEVKVGSVRLKRVSSRTLSRSGL